MQLEPVAVARGGIDVVAIRWPNGTCPVLDHQGELERTHRRLWQEAIMFLRDYLPNVGLPPVVGSDSSRGEAVSPSRKELRDSIWEVRLSVRQRWRRPLAFRLLYFHHRSTRIVLTSSFLKNAPPRTDPLTTAAAARAAYWESVAVAERGGDP